MALIDKFGEFYPGDGCLLIMNISIHECVNHQGNSLQINKQRHKCKFNWISEVHMFLSMRNPTNSTGSPSKIFSGCSTGYLQKHFFSCIKHCFVNHMGRYSTMDGARTKFYSIGQNFIRLIDSCFGGILGYSGMYLTCSTHPMQISGNKSHVWT